MMACFQYEVMHADDAHRGMGRSESALTFAAASRAWTNSSGSGAVLFAPRPAIWLSRLACALASAANMPRPSLRRPLATDPAATSSCHTSAGVPLGILCCYHR